MVARAWTLRAQWVVLALLAGLAAYMGWAHLQLAHGAGTFDSLCNVGGAFNCDEVNTSRYASLFGIPISLYALPLYAGMAWLAHVGVQDSDRGAAARGWLTALAGWNALVSVFMGYVSATDLGFFCLFCITMYVLHAISLGLALMAGPRSLAITKDALIADGLIVAVFAVVAPLSMHLGSQLDAEVVAAVEASAAVATGPASPATQELSSKERAAGRVTIPNVQKQVTLSGHEPSYGPADAAVTVVEFADFECGYCRKLSHTLIDIKKRYGNTVRFVFKHYPMDKDCNDRVSRTHHKRACEVAIAAQCANEQGRFWEYHDLVFRNQKHVTDGDLTKHAERLDLDLGAWNTCRAGDEVLAQIDADIAAAAELEITGTPRTYVNGREFKGASSEAILDAAIRVAQGAAEIDDEGKVAATRTVLTEPPPKQGAIAMVQVDDFWIDAVEASLSADGTAVSEVGADVAVSSWFEAKQACEAAGKRMCTHDEWIRACQGVAGVDDDGDGRVVGDVLEGRAYPYGEHYKPGACWDSGNRDRHTPQAAGKRGACKTPEGVYDLTGNLQEWIGASEDVALLMGGGWYHEDKASCGQAWDTFGPGMVSENTGFRCCADSQVESTAVAVAAPEVEAPAEDEAEPEYGKLEPFEGSDVLDGKVGLVNFWATWCAPCRKELPALAKLQKQLGDKGFQVVAVNVDRKTEDAERVLASSPFPFPTVLDPEAKIFGRYGESAMPFSVLVDREGNIVTQHTGYSEEWMAELTAQIEGLL